MDHMQETREVYCGINLEHINIVPDVIARLLWRERGSMLIGFLHSEIS